MTPGVAEGIGRLVLNGYKDWKQMKFDVEQAEILRNEYLRKAEKEEENERRLNTI